jgi:hypothetical protein
MQKLMERTTCLGCTELVGSSALLPVANSCLFEDLEQIRDNGLESLPIEQTLDNGFPQFNLGEINLKQIYLMSNNRCNDHNPLASDASCCCNF